MKIWRGFPLVGWVLVGLLLVGAGFLTLTRDESRSAPSGSSFAPSGSKAFADLLRVNGYRVEVVRASEPDLPKDATAIMFIGGATDTFSIFTMSRSQQLRTISHVLSSHNAVVLHLSNDFQEDSQAALSTRLDALTAWGKPVVLHSASNSALPVDIGDYPAPEDQVPLARAQNEPIAALSINKGHYLANIRDGIMATNRFIERDDDASFLLAVVSRVASPGSHLVFVDSSYEPGGQPGVIELIGSWAVAAWWQILLLFVVVVYTLGKPFGYPEPDRVEQRGTRELVDGLANIFRRGRANALVLKTIAHDADREIRHNLKLPRDASIQERNARIPQSLATILTEAESGITAGSKDVLKLVKRLQAELGAFLQAKG